MERTERWWRRRPRLPCLVFMWIVITRCGGGIGLGVQGATVSLTGQGLEPPGGIAAASLRSLMQGLATDGGECSVVILADDSTTADAVIEGTLLGYADGGMTTLRVWGSPLSSKEAPTNATASIVSLARDVVIKAKRLRVSSNCLTIVFAMDSTEVLEAIMLQAMDLRFMLWRTHGIIVTSLPRSSVLSTLERLWVFTMLNTHLLLLRTSDAGDHPPSAVVLRHEPYSPVGARTKLVGHYSLVVGLTASAPLHYEKFNNFYGSGINFTMPTFIGVKPITLANGTKSFELSGKAYEMMVSFGKFLNFTATFLNSSEYEQVISQTEFRQSFFVAAMYYVSSRRLKQIDYIAPYTTDDLAFLMRLPTVTSSWDSFMRPFFTEVWLFTLAVVLVLPLCLVLVMKFSYGDNIVTSKLRGGAQQLGAVKGISKTRAVFEVFGALLGQDFSFSMPHTNSFRILLAAWFVFIIVLSTGYKSNLIVFMTSPKIPTRHETLKDLIASNVTVTIESKVHHKMLQTSDNTDYKTIGERCMRVVQKDGLQMVMKQGSAFIEDRERLTSIIAKSLSRADGSKVYLGRERILSSLVAIPIPHDAPFTAQFDTAMLGFVQGGLMDKLEEMQVEKIRRDTVAAAKNNPDDPTLQSTMAVSTLEPLSIVNLQGLFSLFVGGVGLAMLCFVLELIAGKCAKTPNTITTADTPAGTE